MMNGEAWLFLFAVIMNAVNLFLQVFFTIMYSDLEWYVKSASHDLLEPGCSEEVYRDREWPARSRTPADRYANSDYINPIDLCNRLNQYVVPEAAVHGFLTFLFLINGYWLALVLNIPLAAYNAKK